MATGPVTPAPRRFSIRLPRPLWIGLAAGILIVVVVGLSIGVPIYREHAAILPIKPRPDLVTVLPGQVAKLVAWPTPQERAGKVVRADDRTVQTFGAKRSSIRWILTVVSTEWLPDDPNETLSSNLVFLDKVYPGLDTSHVEWEKSGYRFRVSQTKTVFYFSVMPLEGNLADGDSASWQKASRELASKVFNNIPKVNDIDGTEIVRVGTTPILVESSFDQARIRQFDDGIVGLVQNPDFEDPQDLRRFDFWWRRVRWWTNGRTLGLFTLKTEGGSWDADYGSNMDEYWFGRIGRKQGE